MMDRYNQNPQSLVFSRLANEFRKEGNFTKAIEICTNGLLAHPEYVTGRLVLGQCYVEQGNPQAAIQELLAIFIYDRKNQAAMKMLADLYNRQEKLDKAGDLYTLLFRMDPGNKSLRVLSKQFQSTGFNDIYKILGLPSPQTSFNFQSKEVRPDQFSSDMNKTYVESPQQTYNNELTHSVTDELEIPFGTDELSSPQIDSDEIGVRMDALFGDLQSELSDPTQPDLDDSTNMNFAEGVDNSEDKNITGDDVTDRMNALFGNDDKKDNFSGLTESSFSNSEITEISGDDISLHIDMLDQNSEIEQLGMQSLQPDFNLENENEQSDIISIQADLADSSVSGNDISDRFDTLLGAMGEESQPDFADPLSIKVASSMENDDVSGDDISAQLEKLMSSDSFDSDLTFGLAQNADIKEDAAFISPGALRFSEESLSGDDFVSRIEEVTDSNDSLYNNRESENQIGDDLLSTEHVNLSKYTIGDVSGDDFSSHIDSIISSEDTLSQPQSVVNLQDDELNDDTRSVQKDGTLLFEDSSENSEKSTLNDLFIDDQNYRENPSVSTDLIVDVDGSTISSEGMAFLTSDTENLSGDDFSSHIDTILGDDTDKFSPLIQDNLLSDPEDDSATSDNTGIQLSGEERLTGDDVSNQFDSMLGLNSLSSDKSTYDKITQSFDSQYDTAPAIQNDPLSSEGESLSGDDFSAHIDLISGEITHSNQFAQGVQEPDLKDDLITSEDAVSGDDLSARIEEIEDSGSYIPPVSYQKSTNDLLSTFISSEFEETIQFDRSIIERAQAEIDGEPLNADDTPNFKSRVSDEPVDISTNTDYFGVENETISFDRAELNAFIPDSITDVEEIVDQPGSTNWNLNDRLILNVDNPSPNIEPLGEIEDVLVDHDETIISEMDVLVSSVADLQCVTGDDVVQKLDALFPSDTLDIENSSILENVKSQDIDITNPIDYTLEKISETVPAAIDLPQGDEDLNKTNNSAYLSESISGNDVEKRIDDFFGNSTISSGTDDESFASESIHIDESDLTNGEIANVPLDELVGGTFGSVTQDAGIFISEEESQIDELRIDDDAIIFVDSTESLDPEDSEVQSDLLPDISNQSFAKSENQPNENTNISDPQITSAEVDESDRPFSIPDHVLTPTLADIYYQQGQLQLAVQIYSRLLERDPDNLKLSERLEEIQGKIAQQEVQTPVENSYKRKENLKQVSGNIKSVPQKKKTIEIERPLSGVRIKKGKKPRKPDQN